MLLQVLLILCWCALAIIGLEYAGFIGLVIGLVVPYALLKLLRWRVRDRHSFK